MKTLFPVDVNCVRRSGGFSLVELMVVVVIIGLLAAFAYPSYTAYVERANRAEGRAFLLETFNRLERFYSNCNRYPRSIGAATNCASEQINVLSTSQSGKYTLLYRRLSTGQPLLVAQPNNWTDELCRGLVLRANGVRSCTLGCTGNAAKVAECWGK